MHALAQLHVPHFLINGWRVFVHMLEAALQLLETILISERPPTGGLCHLVQCFSQRFVVASSSFLGLPGPRLISSSSNHMIELARLMDCLASWKVCPLYVVNSFTVVDFEQPLESEAFALLSLVADSIGSSARSFH